MKEKIYIFTEEENELKFSVENRKWYKDDGTGDIPCGEVYIAPVEESANGTILIPKITLMGRRFSNVFMEFEKGRLTKCSLREFEGFIKKFHLHMDFVFKPIRVEIDGNVFMEGSKILYLD